MTERDDDPDEDLDFDDRIGEDWPLWKQVLIVMVFVLFFFLLVFVDGPLYSAK